MNIKEELRRLESPQATALSIGVFDGVHIGHKYLLSQLVASARSRAIQGVIITLTEHPAHVLNPVCNIPLITPLQERIRLLEDTGVDRVIPLPFTRELANMRAEAFLTLLQEYLHMQAVVLGHDASIGRHREADAEGIKRLGQRMGFEVSVASPLLLDGEIVSSSAIRKALASGVIEKANRMLGRYFRVSGRVISGSGRGKHLGFPTANVLPPPYLALPADGCYASITHVGAKSYASVTNFGTQPTFQGTGRLMETHLIDFDGDLYGCDIDVDLVYHIRDEYQFDTPTALQRQIKEDVEKVRALPLGNVEPMNE